MPVQLLKQTQVFLDSRSTSSPQDKVECALNYDGANDSLFHISLTEFDMSQSAINLDSLTLPEIYIRMNLPSTNSSSSTLSGSGRTTELMSSNILGKVHIIPGQDRVRWLADTEDAALAVVPIHSIENLELRLTDASNNDLDALAFAGGTWDQSGPGYFSCTLRIANYNYFYEGGVSNQNLNTALNNNIL